MKTLQDIQSLKDGLMFDLSLTRDLVEDHRPLRNIERGINVLQTRNV